MELKADSGPNNRVQAWKRAAVIAKTANTFMDNVSIAPSEAPSDFDTRKQIKYGNAYQAAWGIFSEYCNNSTIHGIKYLGESKRPILERLFWVFVFGLSIFSCSRLTMNIWEKWQQNPVIVSFAEKSTPVWQIPFPAVTVCPETKSRQHLFNFTQTFWKLIEEANLTKEEYFYMDAVSQVCDAHLLGGFGYGSKYNDASLLVKALEEIKPVFNETYFACKWRNHVGTCENMFYKVLTEEGLCYSFNSLEPYDVYRDIAIHDDFILKSDLVPESNDDDSYSNSTEFNSTSVDLNATLTNSTTISPQGPVWNLEDGYASNTVSDALPHRVLGAGARAGLFLVLNGYEHDNDQICRGPVQGFKILMHTPGEIAQVSKQYFRIPFNQEVLISIKPKIITTSDGLKHYLPSIRQCYFQHERYLAYFKLYTQSNCELECLANYTLKKCGCVKLSMPRAVSTPVCGAAKIECFSYAEDELLKNEFEEGLKSSRLNFRGETECNCLPACTSIAYEAEISQADYNYRSQFQALKNNYANEHPGMQMSRLSIFFKEAQFLTSRRSELYGTTDFLANCGGLLGLFMGVSALSLVELIYYCTVRLITNLKMRHNKMTKLKKEMAQAVTSAALGITPEIIISDNDAAKENMIKI